MIGYHPDAFYALSIKEWNAALKAHVHGDGHFKTQQVLAQIGANFVNVHKAKGARKSKPSDFLPWLKMSKTKPQNVDQKIDAFFSKLGKADAVR